MICKYGHDHPPFAVKQPQNPYTGLEGKLHCFKCHYADGKRTAHAHWLILSSKDMIESALATEPLCRVCFPTRGGGGSCPLKVLGIPSTRMSITSVRIALRAQRFRTRNGTTGRPGNCGTRNVYDASKKDSVK